MFEGIDRSINQIAAIVKGFHHHPWRQAGRNLRQLGFHSLDNFPRIFTGPHHDRSAYHLFSSDVQCPSPELAADLDLRNIPKVDGGALALRQDRVLQVGHRFD